MATLISAYTATGTFIGACDARCYNAKDTRCRCICGGRNHARGRQTAAQQTLRDTDWFVPGLSRTLHPATTRIYRNPKLHQWAAPALFEDVPEPDPKKELQQQLHGA